VIGVSILLFKHQVLLKFIERNTSMKLELITDEEGEGVVYTARFFDPDTNNSFFADSEQLSAQLSELPPDARFKSTFWLRDNMYTFETRVLAAADHLGSYMLLLEQLTPIAVTSRRSDIRNEMRIIVNLYEIEPDVVGQAPYRILPDCEPSYTAETFDISAGGFCLVSNDPLDSGAHLFLAEFCLAGKHDFLLPVRLLRAGNCPQTVLFHFDYGFLFIFDSIPDEKTRIAAAITDTLFRTRLATIR
jgi:hypothetical protein